MNQRQRSCLGAALAIAAILSLFGAIQCNLIASQRLGEFAKSLQGSTDLDKIVEVREKINRTYRWWYRAMWACIASMVIFSVACPVVLIRFSDFQRGPSRDQNE